MNIQAALSGGDRRSLGRTQEVVDHIISNPNQFDKLFSCSYSQDEIVRMRACDALEKICRQRPELFDNYKQPLLFELPKIRQASVQWYLAQIYTELDLSETQRQQAVSVMKDNLNNMDDWIVTNLTLESLAIFARRGEFNVNEFQVILQRHIKSRHKSVVSRVNKLLKEFGQ